MDERIVTNHELEADTFEKTIRPDSFDEYVGQTDVKENIKVFVSAARMRGTNLDHVIYMAHLVLVKRHLLILLQMNLEVILKQQVVLL